MMFVAAVSTAGLDSTSSANSCCFGILSLLSFGVYTICVDHHPVYAVNHMQQTAKGLCKQVVTKFLIAAKMSVATHASIKFLIFPCLPVG